MQDALERALAAIADAPVRTIAAGRTDAGVHATMQIVHFDIGVARPDTAWVRGVNAHLPGDVAVLWMRPVAPDFHARNAAEARHYTYVLANRPVRPALLAGRVGWYHRTLDVAAMTQAAQALVGTHDFSAFRAAECQAKSPTKTLTEVTIAPRRRSAAVRFPRRCVPSAHDPQHRRIARVCRRGQAPSGVDRRAPRGHAIARAPRRRSRRTGSISPAPSTTRDGSCRRRVGPSRCRVAEAREIAMTRTRVKICGITRLADGLAAAREGADAIGFVFWAGTPRRVAADAARAIAAALPPFVTTVGLFVDPDPAEVRATLAAVPLDLLQFHGNEPPELCRAFARPYVKAVPVGPRAAKDGLLEYAARYPDAAGWLFDAPPSGGLPGGTGQTFDWDTLPRDLAPPARVVRRAQRRQRRRGDSARAAVGSRRVERRRSDRRRRQAGEGDQGSRADPRVHRGSAPCR